MSAPLVSVVIPAYNAAAFIDETLRSVFAQTLTDFEVVLVNDGSPDTAELERALAPHLGRLVYLKQENKGASAARNAGLRAARGELAAFLDADDLWLPDYLERQAAFLRERPCDLAGADGEIFGQSPDAGRTCMEVLMPEGPACGDASFLQLLSAERFFITSGVVARRALVMEAGAFDEALRNAQDFDLWLRLARRGARLSFQRRTLLRCRTRPESLTGDAINTHRRDLRVFDKVERDYALGPGEREQALAVIRRRRAELEFELGKLYLAKGRFDDARASFGDAGRHGAGWKPGAALWAARLAPGLLRALYLRRLGERAP